MPSALVRWVAGASLLLGACSEESVPLPTGASAETKAQDPKRESPLIDDTPFDPARVMFDGAPVADLLRKLERGTDRERSRAATCMKHVYFGLETFAMLTGYWGLMPEQRGAVLKEVKKGRISPRARVLVPALVRALDDPSPEVRRRVASSLMSVGPEALSACPRLRKALRDKDAYVRAWSARALYCIGDHPMYCIDTSVALMQDEDPQVRAMAAYNIDVMGNDGYPAMPFLEKLANDPVEEVQRQAKQALDVLRRESSVRPEPTKQSTPPSHR
jgi:hypothetical protein